MAKRKSFKSLKSTDLRGSYRLKAVDSLASRVMRKAKPPLKTDLAISRAISPKAQDRAKRMLEVSAWRRNTRNGKR